MNDANDQRPQPAFFQAAYLLCTAAFIIALGYHHFQLINFPLPLSYNEASGITVTDYLLAGGNPYSLEAQPARTSVYPVLSNLVTAPLAGVFGNTLPVHRWLNALLLLGCAALFYRVTFNFCRSHFDTLAATALLYCGFMVFSTPLASPNGIGLILFFGAVYLPLIDNYSRRSLAVALLLGVLALHAKQYFVAGLGFMALLLFLNISKRTGFLFGLSGLAMTVVLLGAILAIAPYYLDATVFAVVGASDIASANEYMWRQWRNYLPTAAPVIVVVGAGVVAASLAVFKPGNIDGGDAAAPVNLKEWNAPLLSKGVNPFWLYLVCCIFIFTFSMGRNPGNELTYLFQLVSPFLLTLAAVAISRNQRWQWPMRAFIVIAFYTHYSALSHDFEIENAEQWQKLEETVAQAESIYATSIILELITRQGGDIYNNGHTTYFKVADAKPEILLRDKPERRVTTLWTNWVEDIHERMRTRQFDLVIVDYWTRMPDGMDMDGNEISGAKLLRANYRVRESLTIALANRPGGGKHTVQIWEPRLKPQD